MRIFHFTRGALLIEILIGFFILTLGITATASLVNAALHANQNHKHRLIAVNLAQEGIEVMHNIRDTNWLTYPSHIRACWNFWEDTDENGVYENGIDDLCDVGISDGQNAHPWGYDDKKTFLLDLNTSNFRWNLVEATGDSRLYRFTSGSFQGLYTHTNSLATEPTLFSREISLYYTDEDTFDATANPIAGGEVPFDASKDNRLLVVSRVFWDERGNAREVVLTTELTDFFQRTEWDS